MSRSFQGSWTARGAAFLFLSRVTRVVLGFVVLAFCAAPVPGDVGGCGQNAEPLDPERFFIAKANADCDRCRDCGLETTRCTQACGPGLVESEFSEGCVPLVHDGEVCLRALLEASCDDYRTYVRDLSPSAPTECNFCPVTSP